MIPQTAASARSPFAASTSAIPRKASGGRCGGACIVRVLRGLLGLDACFRKAASGALNRGAVEWHDTSLADYRRSPGGYCVPRRNADKREPSTSGGRTSSARFHWGRRITAHRPPRDQAGTGTDQRRCRDGPRHTHGLRPLSRHVRPGFEAEEMSPP